MIGYVTLGTRDLERAASFYDRVLAVLGAERTRSTDRVIYWGKRGRLGSLAVIKPFDGQPATVGNGVMVALATRSKEEVRQAYELALKLGAVDEGRLGMRSGGAYGAYFRDLDGNKLYVYTIVESTESHGAR